MAGKISAVGPKDATFAEVRFHPNVDEHTVYRYKSEQSWTAGANTQRAQDLRAHFGEPRIASPTAAFAGEHSYFARKDEASGQWVHAHDSPHGKEGEPAKVANAYASAKDAAAKTKAGRAEKEPGAREKPVEAAKMTGASTKRPRARCRLLLPASW